MNKKPDVYKPAPIGEYLEGPGEPLIITQGDNMTDKSTKATNNEIVKALIVLVQDFFEHNPTGAKVGHPVADYTVTIDEGNLVARISIALNSYRRQKDRIADLLDNMNKIANGG
jgi:hypothetical protein